MQFTLAMKRALTGLSLVFLSACGFFSVGGSDGGKTPKDGTAAEGSSATDGAVANGSKSSGGGGAKAAKPTDVCVTSTDANKSPIENAKAWGRSAAYRCAAQLDEAGMNQIKAWLTIQGMEGGRKNISQLGLAEIYIGSMTNSEGKVPEDTYFLVQNHRQYHAMIGKLLDEKLIDAQMEGRAESDKAYVHERVRFALSIYERFKKEATDDDTLGRWVDAVDKEPEIFKAALEVRKTVTDGLKYKSMAFISEIWKFTPIPACKTAKELFFKIAPASEPMNANELAKRFNTMPRLGLLETLSQCGYLQGLPGEGDGFAAILGEVKWTARSGGKELYPTGDASTVHFVAPFSHRRFPYGEAVSALSLPANDAFERSKCWGGTGMISSSQLEQDYAAHWGEITSVKDSDKGVLVTFKKHSWLQDKIECNKDGGAPWFNGVSWQDSRTCKAVGKEKATHQEAPTYFSKEAAKELKAGRMLSFIDSSSGKDGKLACDHKQPNLDNFGLPLYVHSNGGNEFKTDDQVQYFYWPVKREASTKPASKK